MEWSEDAGRGVLAALPGDERLVLPALQAVQHAFGHVPEAAVALVALELNVSRADVHGVLTYYPDLRREPPAPVVVRVCGAEACAAVGGSALGAAATAWAGPDVEVEPVFCLGLCAVGPAASVNDRLVARADGDALLGAVRAAADGIAR